MFYLHVSNRTENLLRHLVEVIRVDGDRDFFQPELFLIQSRGMERMVTQTLADEFGCCCNFKFLLPIDFLEETARRLRLEMSENGFQRQVLSWRIEGMLRDLDDPVFAPISRYLEGDGKGRKRLQLARKLANIFDQYQLMRGDMLAGWSKDRPGTDHPAERWQCALWQRLIAQRGGDIHRGVLFERICAELKAGGQAVQRLPRRISILGIHTMPPVYLQFLELLAHHADVHLFLLSPCRNYWGDTPGRKDRRRLEAENTDGALHPDAPEYHPLLAALGRQGRDLQNMMLSGVTQVQEFASYQDPLEEKDYRQLTLLEKIQADLFHGRRCSSSEAGCLVDPSVQIVSCHSKLRELMVLKDHILNLLHCDDSLELRDIVVMAPDIQDYSILIPSVFADIQHSIADRSVRTQNNAIGTFVFFLGLYAGRFGVSEVMDLMQQPLVHRNFQLSEVDLEQVEHWVAETGIRWGLSREQRAEDGLASFGESSWRAGLDRLLMGYAIDSDGFVDTVLPYGELEGQGAAPLGGLCRFIELVGRGRNDFKNQYSLVAWSELLREYVDFLFGDSTEQEVMDLRLIIAELGEAGQSFNHCLVEFDTITDWFAQTARETRSSSGFLRGQLTFCSMLPMRSIPFQAVCILGLNEGEFPKNKEGETFDLMTLEQRPGDRSPRDDDRYQFLEAMLSARRGLYLSYIGQSIKTNDKIPPSVVVAELVEVLENDYGVKEIVVHHPLHPFSARYFSREDDRHLFSYSHHFCEVAKIIRGDKEVARPWWQGRRVVAADSVEFVEMLRFFRNPQKYFIRERVGIYLEPTTEDQSDLEIFTLSGLAKYQAEQALVDAVIQQRTDQPGSRDELLLKLQTQGEWPLGEVGRIDFLERLRAVELFGSQLTDAGERLDDHPFELRVGQTVLRGTLENIYEKGVMLYRYGSLRGQDLLLAGINHAVARQLIPGISTFLVTLDEPVSFTGTQQGVSLERLVELYLAGCEAPLPFFVEPGLAYARCRLSSRGAKDSPLEKAAKEMQQRVDRGYEPEAELLFGDASGQVVVGPDFGLLAEELMCAFWRNGHGHEV
ncbi:exodeoxyribonuclease V subunit gamma [Desulforhopalus singaporensis]|uniref:DNA helicase/exodeoxyribonuclease V, gamma subunit n=1 Tax=Desulforhopalus singaporensis TaxID=91360 RepID=A0A1H0TLD5_9BACT|nr:exodeoxyribonuclease V subunit gamma [Desulforhopalus singaporensis]SDP54872.1 DNA helicase/exodeoxyribonuclease V, gamma subunit [Desulforhopalus singaporensis]